MEIKLTGFKKVTFTAPGYMDRTVWRYNGVARGALAAHKQGKKYSISLVRDGGLVLSGFRSLKDAKIAIVRLGDCAPFETFEHPSDFSKEEFKEARRIGLAMKKANCDPLAGMEG